VYDTLNGFETPTSKVTVAFACIRKYPFFWPLSQQLPTRNVQPPAKQSETGPPMGMQPLNCTLCPVENWKSGSDKDQEPGDGGLLRHSG
jgi:hypothetical protein